MANNPSAKKRHRQSLLRRGRNRHWLSTVRHAIRKARAAAEGGDPDAPQLASSAEQLLRKAASKGVLHSRTVDRTVSRLHRSAKPSS
jgi:small subunit ribosomal protein S20